MLSALFYLEITDLVNSKSEGDTNIIEDSEKPKEGPIDSKRTS